ncbi:MAG: cation diffusion facilitator family transporter [Methanocorpusculum sp.]|nr:cation diffusion facilitator family transporter [Methanocorpusculum sp.]
MSEENKQKQNVARLSIGSNAFLTLSKLITGFSIGSVSIISEGIHSGMDLVASTIAYFSVRKSSLPPDSDHAFGHGKYEDASGLIEALLIVLAAGIIIWEAVSKLIRGGEPVSIDLLYAGMIVMGLSALLNFFVSQRLMKVAKATDSIALESDAWHLRTDVLTSAGVFLGLLLIQLTGLVVIDSVIAIIVAIFILREAYVLIRRSFADLMDESLDKDEIQKIEEIICRHENEYTNFHSLMTRKAGPDKFVVFHLMMPHSTQLTEAHAVLQKIEDEIKAEIPRANVMVHLDPCDGRCKKDKCTFFCKDYRKTK